VANKKGNMLAIKKTKQKGKIETIDLLLCEVSRK
jgi:hypothetical protein